ITSKAAEVGNTFTRFESGDVGADFDNNAGSFLPIDERQGRRITTLAEIDINEVHARRFDLNQRFVRFEFGSGHVNEREHFRPARLRYLNSFHEAIVNGES